MRSVSGDVRSESTAEPVRRRRIRALDYLNGDPVLQSTAEYIWGNGLNARVTEMCVDLTSTEGLERPSDLSAVAMRRAQPSKLLRALLSQLTTEVTALVAQSTQTIDCDFTSVECRMICQYLLCVKIRYKAMNFKKLGRARYVRQLESI